MASTGDVLQVKLFFSQAGNEALIVSYFVYEQAPATGPAPEDQIAESYFKLFADSLRSSTLHNSANMVKCVVDNLTDGLSFGEYAEVAAGGLSGDPAPSFVAIDVKQNVGNRLTRSGRKRLPFTSEAISDGNVCLISGTDLTAIENFFGSELDQINPIDFDVDGYLAPVIVKRVEDPVGSGHYVLDIAQLNPVRSAQVIGMTSQTSRKP